ncbi:nuclear transport factor 2 family protein [Lysinibacillus sp. NPDC096418]|uniref:nuclear transport factor 2 family protein n=1 Tax=Lysinibacillus sp. NPDC096418 TaxID=3364138 RepID=UPI003829F4FB
METTTNIKIIYSEDCGNNYRNKLIREFYIAFTKKNIDFILDHVENDVHWQIVDIAFILGKEQFTKRIKQHMENVRIKTLHIKNIVINGRTSAVNGIVQSVENKNYSFCDIYHFSNAGKHAKIQRISSYINNFSMEVTNVCYH